jgi:hypothetical protein
MQTLINYFRQRAQRRRIRARLLAELRLFR